jgi:hypothetical protein
MFSAAVTIVSVGLLAVLLTRAVRGGFLPRFPFFYSYIVYMLLRTVVSVGIMFFLPQYHAAEFWFSFAIWQIVEFAVLIEISDHIFERYPAIRSLGRLICASLTFIFLVLYIFPAFASSGSPSEMILELAKRASLTKAAIVLVLLIAQRLYNLRMGRSVTGILVGFSIFLGVSIANFQLAEHYGRAVYAPIFRIVGPLSWTLALLVWAVALWNYEPGFAGSRPPDDENRAGAVPVAAQLARFNHLLLKLLQR